jgi:hypothetical protein
MSDIFQCGDEGALVAYLYDECEPHERETIAAHLKRCLACSSDIESLSATRRTLAAWTPPDMALGFQITRPQDVGPAKVLERKVPWWRAPLPAWAQAAAAVIIFAAGLSIGFARSGAPVQAPSREGEALASPSRPTTPVVSRDDLAQLEQRLKAQMAQIKSAPITPVATHVSDDGVMQQVKTMLEQSEERQRRDFTLRMVELAGNIETQRRVDLASVQSRMGQQQGVIGTELRQQREAIDRVNNYLVTVSERGR